MPISVKVGLIVFCGSMVLLMSLYLPGYLQERGYKNELREIHQQALSYPTPAPTATPPPTPIPNPTTVAFIMKNREKIRRGNATIQSKERLALTPPPLSKEWGPFLMLIHAEVNRVRHSHQKPALTYEPVLSDIAQGHSEQMAKNNYMAHEDAQGRTARDRLVESRYYQAGFRCTGNVPERPGRYQNRVRISENLLTTLPVNVGRKDKRRAAEVVESWMMSPSHREALLNGMQEYQGFGIAFAADNTGYITQLLCFGWGGPRVTRSAPKIISAPTLAPTSRPRPTATPALGFPVYVAPEHCEMILQAAKLGREQGMTHREIAEQFLRGYMAGGGTPQEAEETLKYCFRD